MHKYDIHTHAGVYMQMQKNFLPFKLYPYVWSPINNLSGKNILSTNSQEIGFFYPCHLLTLPTHVVTPKYQSIYAFKAFRYVVPFSWKFYIMELVINYL